MFKVDDILKRQADIDFMSEAANDAAQNMKIEIEQDVFDMWQDHLSQMPTCIKHGYYI